MSLIVLLLGAWRLLTWLSLWPQVCRACPSSLECHAVAELEAGTVYISIYKICKCKLALYWVMLKVLGTRRFSRLFCYVTCWGLPVWKPTFSIIQQLHLRAKRALLEKRFFEMSCVRLWHNWHSSLWEPFHWQLRIQDSFKCHMFDSESYLAKVWTVDSGPATSCRDAIRNHPAKCASTLHNECSTAHCWLLA